MKTSNCPSVSNITIVNKTSVEVGNNLGKKDVYITDDSLSNLHARIFLAEDAVWMEELEGRVYTRLVKGEEHVIC